MIYKFMDDMDKEALEFGGEATFFTGEYERYGWSKIFDPRLSGYDMLNLYSEAIQKMNQNPNIPQLFRDIFKNAFLPYRDPEMLKMFLKEINGFQYDHSERLGDAFEYLLSVLGSQGDAGQFRTPRHIIDFIWESFQINYDNGKYPFAFIAYHMLYMSFVYFEVWQIKENCRKDFELAMVGFTKDHEKSLIEATTPFSFWTINERSFFRFLKLLNCDNGRIGNYAKIVDHRNDAAHSNGNIFFNSQASVDAKIDDVLRFVDDIQFLSHPIIEACLANFLKTNWNPDEREYYDDQEQLQEVLIHGNYLSQKDVEQMLRFDINRLATEPHFAEMRSLFDAFTSKYAKAD